MIARSKTLPAGCNSIIPVEPIRYFEITGSKMTEIKTPDLSQLKEIGSNKDYVYFINMTKVI